MMCVDDPLDLGPARAAIRARAQALPDRGDGCASCGHGSGNLIDAYSEARTDGCAAVGKAAARPASDRRRTRRRICMLYTQLVDGPVARHSYGLGCEVQCSNQAIAVEAGKPPSAGAPVLKDEGFRSTAEQDTREFRPITIGTRKSELKAPASPAWRDGPIFRFKVRRSLAEDRKPVQSSREALDLNRRVLARRLARVGIRPARNEHVDARLGRILVIPVHGDEDRAPRLAQRK